MLSSLGSDAAQVIKFGFALVIILAVVGTFILILRRLTGGRLISSERENSRSRQPRLGVVDVYDLDRSRQLVLLRRDNVEHLLLLGGANDVVIETNIVRVATTRTSGSTEIPADRGELSFDRTPESPTARFIPEQPARPVFEGAGSFRGGVGEHVNDFLTTPDPVFYNEAQQRAEPVFDIPAPPAQPRIPDPVAAATQAAITAASFAAVAAATRYDAVLPATQSEHEVSIPQFLREQAEHRHSSYPSVTEVQPASQYDHHVELPYVEFPHVDIQAEKVTHFEEPIAEFEPAVPQPHFADYAAPPLAQIEPEIEPEAYHRPVYASEPEIATEPAAECAPEPTTEPEPEPEVYPEQPQQAHVEEAPAEPTIHLDEAMLSGMARQLEEALKGSLSDLHEPVTLAQPVPAQDIEEPVFEAQAPEAPHYEQGTAFSVPADEKKTDFASPVWEEPSTSETPAAEPEQPLAPQEAEKDPSPTQQKPLEAQLSPLPKADDPFSVDDIEAEFARLLGRNSGKNDKG